MLKEALKNTLNIGTFGLLIMCAAGIIFTLSGNKPWVIAALVAITINAILFIGLMEAYKDRYHKLAGKK